MKIAYLLTQSLDSPSGLGRYGPMARALAARGHQVEIFALHPDFSSLEKKKFEDRGVQVHYVAPMHIKKTGSTKTYYPAWQLLGLSAYAAIKLISAAAASDAEIVHTGKPHPMNSLAGLAAHKLKRKRLFLDCDDYETGSSRFSGGWQKKGVAYFERRMPFQAEIVTTNTHFMRRKLADWGVEPDRIVYLPNGVEPARFPQPQANRLQALRRELAIEGKKVVSFIGSLSLPSHPVDLLVQAFSLLAQRIPDTVLLLVGGGEDYARLQDLVRDLGLGEQVRFTGRVPSSEVVNYYALSDVSVDPVYDNEGARGRSPLKLFESWVCGVPFVTADVGDRSELMGAPKAGVLTEGLAPEAYAAAIEIVLRDPSLAQSLSARGLQRVEEFYWPRLACTLEEIYQHQPSQVKR